MNGKRITGTGHEGGDIESIEILINFGYLSEEGNLEPFWYGNAIVQNFVLLLSFCSQFEKTNK